MLISAILAFLMLGTAKRVPDPYWNILLHLHESPLAVFTFCVAGSVIRVLVQPRKVMFRGRPVAFGSGMHVAWTLLTALLLAFAAASYRYTSIRGYAAFHDRELFDFNPWLQTGNVFAITAASLAATIAMAHLRDETLLEKGIGYAAALIALASFSPLLLPLGYLPYHLPSLAMVAALANGFYLAAWFIQRRWGVL
ncbi:MAG: hypothetical protein C4523_00925 [Myxococcales bacterium]|nr:MAG: hypothetical protein C4523_00925 [Myxococcales bacterium]